MKSLLIPAWATLLVCLTCASSSAKETVMYKKIDENGKIIFTDKPIPGSKPITIKTDTNVVSTPKPVREEREEQPSPKGANEMPEQDTFQYQVLAIDTPTNDESVTANGGELNVIVGITPNIQPNHSLQLVMDGKAASSPQKIPYFSLKNTASGTHQLAVTVIDDDTGEQIQESDAITFHILK